MKLTKMDKQNLKAILILAINNKPLPDLLLDKACKFHVRLSKDLKYKVFEEVTKR